MHPIKVDMYELHLSEDLTKIRVVGDALLVF